MDFENNLNDFNFDQQNQIFTQFDFDLLNQDFTMNNDSNNLDLSILNQNLGNEGDSYKNTQNSFDILNSQINEK